MIANKVLTDPTFQPHTNLDVMKEFLVENAEFSQNGFPKIQGWYGVPGEGIDFESSLSRKIKNHKNLTVNFYIDDHKFERVWKDPDKYLEHLSYFHSVIMPDFTIDTAMPRPMKLWNKYRSCALAHYWRMHGIEVIPNVNILDKRSVWQFEGLPQRSVVSCCTNGRIKARKARIEFCEGFKTMLEVLNPRTVIIVGRIPEELDRNLVEIIQMDSRNMMMEKDLGKKS